MSHSRKALAAAVLAVTVALSAAGCAQDGDQIAHTSADQMMATIADDLTLNTVHEDSYDLAKDATKHSGSIIGGAEYTIEALSWSGGSFDDAGAQIQIRITVNVLDRNDEGFGYDPGPGLSIRCWNLVVLAVPGEANLQSEETTCPPGAVALLPTPIPEPSGPADGNERMLAAIEGATAADIDARVAAVFNDDVYSIFSAAQEGELVVALGTSGSYFCVVGVVHADGSTEAMTFGIDQTVTAGVTTCSPELYFSPAATP